MIYQKDIIREFPYGGNYEKTYFVIDSPITAFMVSILSNECPVNLILERKSGLETDDASKLLLNFINSCISVKSMKHVEVPPRFFINSIEINKIWKIRKSTRKLYDEYSNDVVFVGAQTSTFMRSIPRKYNNIIYLYHGLTDLFQWEILNERKWSFVSTLQEFIIGKIIGMPHSTWCHYWAYNAYSLCKLNNEHERWLNVYDFKSPVIEKELRVLGKYKDNKRNILFLPIFTRHSVDGVDSDTSIYDERNCKFLLSHIDKDDRVFIKYHPWLYRANDNIKDSLTQKIRDMGIEAYDIVELIPESVGGAIVPTEVICNYFTFNKIITQDTSTMWYLTDNHQIEKIIDIRYSDEDYRQEMFYCIEHIKKKHNDDIQYYF
ncbi:hypothetical protein SAMN02910342_03060 [Butyrivibrio sp. INlla21]|nr:hypothetical protein SAMN02910342_03060 [Butyrivibrio sp. INlla21]